MEKGYDWAGQNPVRNVLTLSSTNEAYQSKLLRFKAAELECEFIEMQQHLLPAIIWGNCQIDCRSLLD